MATKAGASFDQFAKCKILFRKRENENSRTPIVGALRVLLNHFHAPARPQLLGNHHALRYRVIPPFLLTI
jgi:hypothetical protein